MTTGRIWCLGAEDSHLRIPFFLALARLGLKVTAVGSGPAEPFEREGVPYLRYDLDRFLNPVRNLGSLRTLRRLVAAHRPDIVHGFDTKPSLLAPLAVAGAGTGQAVRTINGMGYLFSTSSPLTLALRPVYRALQRHAAARTAMTVFQNEEDLAYFTAHRLVAPERARLIPSSGIDVARFDAATPPPAETAGLRRALGLEGAKVVICVSRLTRQKGIPTLLAAAERLAARRADVRFLVVGPRETEGPLAVSQAALDRHAAYVQALGPRDDVPALLALADVFVLPTEYREGVPRALLEAGLAGLPLVATRMPGCTRVVRDGWNGRLVAPGDAAALASTIEAVLDAPEEARAMGARSRTIVEGEFSLERVARAYADLYAEVLAEAPQLT